MSAATSEAPSRGAGGVPGTTMSSQWKAQFQSIPAIGSLCVCSGVAPSGAAASATPGRTGSAVPAMLLPSIATPSNVRWRAWVATSTWTPSDWPTPVTLARSACGTPAASVPRRRWSSTALTAARLAAATVGSVVTSSGGTLLSPAAVRPARRQQAVQAGCYLPALYLPALLAAGIRHGNPEVKLPQVRVVPAASHTHWSVHGRCRSDRYFARVAKASSSRWPRSRSPSDCTQ